MATTAQLTAWIAALEIARQEFLVNGVEEYYVGAKRVRYYSISEVTAALNDYKRQLAAQTTNGFSYAKFVRPT